MHKEPANETIVFSQLELQEYWAERILGDDYLAIEARQAFEQAFLHYIGEQQAISDLAMRGGWTFKLKAGLVKTAISGAFMSGLFCFMQFDAIGAAVLPSILPFLFELDKIELSRKEETILAQLLLREEVKTNLHSAEELYALLPPATKILLNPLDFQDFLDQLDLAGHLKEKEGRVYQLSEKARFKLTII